MKGVSEMTNALKKIAEKFPDRVAAALFFEAQVLMTESKRRCPVAVGGGLLLASGQVHRPERQGRYISVLLSYGGAAEAYAIAVHEHMSEHSPWTWIVAELTGKGIQWSAEGTGPKFLEGPINEAMPEMAARLAARVRLDQGS